MRGAPLQEGIDQQAKRIIPADAGSTDVIAFYQGFTKDHPRGCGEHGGIHCRRRRAWGSSPRMRGALADKADRRDLRRIIPADAGSTLHRPRPAAYREDHPRGCGEHEP